MKKQKSNLKFPGQKTGTVTLYIKSNNEELHIQLALFDSLEDFTQNNS